MHAAYAFLLATSSPCPSLAITVESYKAFPVLLVRTYAPPRELDKPIAWCILRWLTSGTDQYSVKTGSQKRICPVIHLSTVRNSISGAMSLMSVRRPPSP